MFVCFGSKKVNPKTGDVVEVASPPPRKNLYTIAQEAARQNKLNEHQEMVEKMRKALEPIYKKVREIVLDERFEANLLTTSQTGTTNHQIGTYSLSDYELPYHTDDQKKKLYELRSLLGAMLLEDKDIKEKLSGGERDLRIHLSTGNIPDEKSRHEDAKYPIFHISIEFVSPNFKARRLASLNF